MQEQENNEYEDQKSIDQDVLKKAFQLLSEHFDTVQIFTTRHEPVTESGTLEYSHGIGNYYARIGQIGMWVEKQKAENTSESLSSMFDGMIFEDLEDYDDEGEDGDEEGGESE